MTIAPVRPDDLAGLLDAREHPMASCSLPWLKHFNDVPDNAAIPLAMSGPHPRATGSYGAECIEWAEAELGITPRWWQALAITRQLEHDKDGALVWREIVESGPRRIGKSVRLRIVALWRTAHADRIGEKQLSMLVSKDLAVGKEIHRGAWRWAEMKGWKVTRLNGGQEVEAPGESRWLLRAEDAVYGYDVGYGQVDESWGVKPTAITDGLEPALLERLWSQLHLTSTAHVRATSLMRRRLVAALRDADPDILLLLWGARPGADLAKEATWRAASPYWSEDRRSLIARKYAAALAGQDEPEFDDPDPVRGWAAQYLNIWPLSLSSSPNLTLPGWPRLAADHPSSTLTAVGLAVSLNGSHGSIAQADIYGEGMLNLDAIERRPGTSWMAKRVRELQEEHGCVVAMDEKCPDATLLDALRDEGVDVEVMNLEDYVEAWSRLTNRVRDGLLTHQAAPELDDAIAAAGLRNVGDGRKVPGRVRSAGDIDMLEAAVAAAWGAWSGGSTYEQRGALVL